MASGGTLTSRSRPPALSPQEEAAADVAARVLGVGLTRSAGAGLTLVYPDGRRAAFEEATIGEQHDLLHAPRRTSDMQWPAPARWWWKITVNDVRCLARVREIFPMTARTCEANGVSRPADLPAAMVSAVPDLHWLAHTVPARLIGHPDVLDRPATVTLGRVEPAHREMTSVVPALEQCLAHGGAARSLSRLGRRRAAERQLYLTVGYTGLAPATFDELVRAGGIPPSAPRARPGFSHLWVAPVLGRAVFLWSRDAGWSRHEPYSQ
ncbi:MAG: hypothetical protein QOG57_4734 [Pseudonocardiales bacterium]|nr:hypothetical protein [Pseudonocardiales bacterium]